jgi:hypothetical protein
MDSSTSLIEQTDTPAPESTSEQGYTPKRYIYFGLRISVTLRDQIGNPLTILFDTRQQVMNFLYGFGAIMQKGQIIQFECDALGISCWIRGQSPEKRDEDGKRIMPTHGDPVFDALYSSLHVNPDLSEEMLAWEKYTSHNPEWYLKKTQERFKESSRASEIRK